MSIMESDAPLTQVFLRMRVRLQGIAYAMLGTTEQAEEVVQEAYLKIVERSAIDDVQKPEAFCSQVVRNLARDLYRRQCVESSYRVFTDDGELPAVTAGLSLERVVDGRRTLAAVEQALAGLPARTRRAFELYRLAGMTQREIGKVLDCSATLVNFMIKDAMAALMHCQSPAACATRSV